VEAEPAGYPVVALGGTFDHLHAAHKLLIHLALFICTRKLIVGVMVDSLLSGKSNADLVEPLSARLAAVEAFVSRRGGVIPDVVPISDAYGPTAYDDDIDALVVSQETASGGAAVNAKRKEANLRPLDIYTVEVIGSTSRDFTNLSPEELKDLKLGSTAIRQYIADQAPVGRNF
jgi:pantetheine-phosphate adenylyltransferase